MVARASRLRSFGLPQKPQAGRSRHHGKAAILIMTQAMDFPPFGVPPLGGIPTEVGTPNAEEPRARRHNENC